jgi:hypothetical protein
VVGSAIHSGLSRADLPYPKTQRDESLEGFDVRLRCAQHMAAVIAAQVQDVLSAVHHAHGIRLMASVTGWGCEAQPRRSTLARENHNVVAVGVAAGAAILRQCTRSWYWEKRIVTSAVSGRL